MNKAAFIFQFQFGMKVQENGKWEYFPNTTVDVIAGNEKNAWKKLKKIRPYWKNMEQGNIGSFVRICDVRSDYRTKNKKGIVLVNVYSTDRNYGGPEEGGWYYYSETCVYSMKCHQRNANKHIKRLEEEYARHEVRAENYVNERSESPYFS